MFIIWHSIIKVISPFGKVILPFDPLTFQFREIVNHVAYCQSTDIFFSFLEFGLAAEAARRVDECLETDEYDEEPDEESDHDQSGTIQRFMRHVQGKKRPEIIYCTKNDQNKA